MQSTSTPARAHAPTGSDRRTWPLLAIMLFALAALVVGAACSSSADGASSASVAEAVEATNLLDSGRIVGTLTTSNPSRFLQGELQHRYDGADAQASVSVATNASGTGAVVVDSSLIDGVGAQRWPLTTVWTEGDPRFPSPAIDQVLTVVADSSDDFEACPSNTDGLDGYCASIEDVTLIDSSLDAFNISRAYTASDPVEVTVWVDQDTGTLNAIFVEATNATEASQPADQQGDTVDLDLRYSLLGEPAVFSPIEIVCADFETELEYITCMADLGVDPVPPWNG